MTLANASTTLFGPRTDLTGYSRPVHVVAGDLNGDGFRDLVTPNNTTGTVGCA